jgi:hypothetical protein
MDGALFTQSCLSHLLLTSTQSSVLKAQSRF